MTRGPADASGNVEISFHVGGAAPYAPAFELMQGAGSVTANAVVVP